MSRASSASVVNVCSYKAPRNHKASERKQRDSRTWGKRKNICKKNIAIVNPEFVVCSDFQQGELQPHAPCYERWGKKKAKPDFSSQVDPAALHEVDSTSTKRE
jgi:hypothetical protein